MTRDLRAKGLVLGYDGEPVVRGLDLALPGRGTTVIVGANGCGKSTLLRGLARLLRPRGGTVLLDGSPLAELPGRELARVLGILPQSASAPDGITVADLVARGRYPHQGWWRRPDAEDTAAVDAALASTDTADLAGRRVDELSGGQRQRVWLAMALAQDPEILLLDEPTTFLDVAHQLDVLDLLHEQSRAGRTVVMVLHDLNLAARYADHLVVLAAGRLLRQGPPGEVLTPEVVRAAFGLEARVVPDPVAGTPMVIPLSRHHRPD